MKTQTIEQFHADLMAQGVPPEHLAFKCPMCGTKQSAKDLMDAGVGKTAEDVSGYIGFSCFGRWNHGKPPPKKKGTQKGCNWTLGGLFRFHNLTVVAPDGEKHARFEVCSPEEAQELMNGRGVPVV